MRKEKELETTPIDDDVIVKLENVTKDYGKGRGIFDINLEVRRGKTLGYCGTNGAGKTTTLRHMMGFLKPDKGTVRVFGLDPYKNSEKIMAKIGYLPGEIAFPLVENGSEFLEIQAELTGQKDMSKAERIINMMQLDPTANIRRMSKGMKQKTAIVAAFMNSPELIILDEPTTGLDPLMREAFVNLIKEEKARGATIVMSNHMFDELEETCDTVAFIRDGHILDIVDMETIHNRPFREYKIGFYEQEDFESADTSQVEVLAKKEKDLQYIVRVPLEKTDGMFRELKKHHIRYISEVQYTLEQYFLEHVVGGKKDGK
ncbi:MAG: ATP-binding cassette domain-containing protein [Bacilli bacterium]|nr:ATP-binding cassette domain-containing protein [Bacilli bacterium]MBO4682307.1 ATP-binding cassette domain-containing protein [Bacilli bacterium]